MADPGERRFMAHKEKRPCKDCLECQLCSETRCRQCRKGGHRECSGDLGPMITHGEYLKWKKRKGKDRGGTRGQEDIPC